MWPSKEELGLGLAVSASFGLAAMMPPASHMPELFVYTQNDTGVVKQIQRGAWVTIATSTAGSIDGPHYVGGTSALGTTFVSGWSNAPGYQPLFFYKTGAGVVHIEGVVQATASNTPPSGIFSLPTGYRPVGGIMQIAASLDSSGGIYAANCSLATSGLVAVAGFTATSGVRVAFASSFLPV